MTIAVAWTRGRSPNEELVFVTDSRLSGDGRTFDACPKVQLLPRPDCAIAFAGETGHAYPMMQQLSLAIGSHAPLLKSELDLPALRSHAIKIFNKMSSTIESGIRPSNPEDTYPGAEFLFGGYSWGHKKFQLWRIHYDPSINGFAARPAGAIGYSAKSGFVRISQGRNNVEQAGLVAFAGDQANVAKDKLQALLKTRTTTQIHDPLDWEPLAVVRNMLRDANRSHTIGGPPQVLKVHQYPCAEPLAVKWGIEEAGVFLQGREFLGYERTERFVIDPDTMMVSAPFVPETLTLAQMESEPDGSADLSG